MARVAVLVGGEKLGLLEQPVPGVRRRRLVRLWISATHE